jgi:hypothetical protein
MRSKLLLVLLFICSPITLNLSAYTKVTKYVYRDKFSRCLFKFGIDSFLDKIKKEAENTYTQIYINALYDAIDLAPDNNKTGSDILKQLSYTLSKRIQRIENLTGKKIEPQAIALGLGFVGISAGLTYAIHYFYKTYYTPNKNKFDALKKTLEDQGIKVTTRGEDITITTPESSPLLDVNKANELFDLYHKQGNFNGWAFIGGLLAVSSVLYGAIEISNGLSPHYDDQYLTKYQSMLEITKHFIRNYRLL